MNNHKDAIKNIQARLKALAEKKRELKREIVALKYDEQGNRRPETGPQRDQLWNSYQWPSRYNARCCHLALGFLRGRPYAMTEPKTHDDVTGLAVGIRLAILAAFGDDEEQKTLWTVVRILDLLRADAEAKEAA